MKKKLIELLAVLGLSTSILSSVTNVEAGSKYFIHNYAYSKEMHDIFDERFEEWSFKMKQSYETLHYRWALDPNNRPSFIYNKTADLFFNMIEYNGKPVGFSEYPADPYIEGETTIQIFTIKFNYTYGYLYVFGHDVKQHKPVVLFIDAQEAIRDGYYNAVETDNKELIDLFYQFSSDYMTVINNPRVPTGVDKNGLTAQEFFSKSLEERAEYCNTTPWYEIPVGFCYSLGMLPVEHFLAAQEYAINSDEYVGIDEALYQTYDDVYYENHPYWKDKEFPRPKN